MSGAWCTTLCCLAHRENGFVRLDVDPPVFVHTGGMAECGEAGTFDLETLTIPAGEHGPGWALPSLWAADRGAEAAMLGRDPGTCARHGCGHQRPVHERRREHRRCASPGCGCPGWTEDLTAVMPAIQGDLFDLGDAA
jgi:hypothetical protein